MPHVSAQIFGFCNKGTIPSVRRIPYLFDSREFRNVHHDASAINNTPSEYMEGRKQYPDYIVTSLDSPKHRIWGLLPFVDQ